MRPHLPATLALLLLTQAAAPATGNAQLVGSWQPNGVRIASGPASTRDQLVGLEDGAGGAFFVWRDDRDGVHNLYAARLDGTGNPVAGWTAAGIRVAPSTSDESTPQIAPDGFGGFFIAWMDSRESPAHVYAQHVLASGAIAAGWPAAGKSLVPGTVQANPQIVPDGAGGFLLSWDDTRTPVNSELSGLQLYAAHLTSSGDVTSGWPALGLQISEVPSPPQNGSSGYASDGIAPDRHGGAFIPYFYDYGGQVCELGCYPYSFRWSNLVHVDGAGAITSLVHDDSYIRGAVATDAGGNAWYAGGAPYDFFFDRFASSATELFTGGVDNPWGVLAIAPDPGLGVLFVVQYPMAALSVDSLGAARPGWTSWVPVVSTGPLAGPGAVSAANGRWILAWSDARSDASGDLFAEEIDRNAAVSPGWSAGGNPVCNATGAQLLTATLSDGAGGAILGWTDTRSGSSDVYAQRIGLNLATPVEVSLVSAAATPAGVRIVWELPEGSSGSALVERRTAEGAWQTLGPPRVLDLGRVEYDDAGAAAGARYDYRLGFGAAGGRTWSAEVWIDVPASAPFALAGLAPNPSGGARLQVAFSLPSDAPATLELIDVAGRRVASRDVGGSGPGEHVETLVPPAPVASGLYWLRLTQSGQSRIAKAVVAR
ncbi:MAG TPA: T9SS type A sorting domain-containing protein [Candidatus Acidoferrales bacterium]|nr:T9SS type A sorting domain-containing protein [Candidatus Acidoferrales bacterium]